MDASKQKNHQKGNRSVDGMLVWQKLSWLDEKDEPIWLKKDEHAKLQTVRLVFTRAISTRRSGRLIKFG